jgi:hypothetical protein
MGVATSIPADLEHAREAKVMRIFREALSGKGHRLRDVVLATALACRDAEQHSTVARYMTPVVRSHCRCLNENRPE